MDMVLSGFFGFVGVVKRKRETAVLFRLWLARRYFYPADNVTAGE